MPNPALARNKLPAHAKFGPSSMGRIMACPASVALSEAAPPQPESPYAAEGTLAHECAEAMLLGEPLPEGPLPDDMLPAVQEYFNLLDPLLDDADHYGIEERAIISNTLFGTVDCWMTQGRTLFVTDYKHGQGVIVSPIENKQLMTYAALILSDEQISVSWDDIDEVILTIVQPRGQGLPITHWNCPTQRIQDHLIEVFDAMQLAEEAHPPIKIGDHCRFCRAKLTCPAMRKAEEGVLDWDSRDLDPEELGELLTMAHVLEARIKALFAYGHSRIEAGEPVPGWKLVPKRATRKWVDVDGVERWAKRNGKINLLHKKGLLSPTQAAKVLGDDYSKIERFVDAVSSGTNIVPSEDSREEMQSPIKGLAALGARNA